MLAVALLRLPMFRSGYEISRNKGLVFVGAYVLYLLYLVASVNHAEWVPVLEQLVLSVLLPAMIAFTLVFFIRDLRKEK